MPCSPLPCPPPASNHLLSSIRAWGASKQHVEQPAGSVRALSAFVQPCRTTEGLDCSDQHSNQGWCECKMPPQSWEEWTWSESSITLHLWTTCLSSQQFPPWTVWWRAAFGYHCLWFSPAFLGNQTKWDSITFSPSSFPHQPEDQKLSLHLHNQWEIKKKKNKTKQSPYCHVLLSFFLFFCWTTWHNVILVPRPGIEPMSPHWKHRVLTFIIFFESHLIGALFQLDFLKAPK